jgi:peptidoglycan hydrolase CwlO-like protein
MPKVTPKLNPSPDQEKKIKAVLTKLIQNTNHFQAQADKKKAEFEQADAKQNELTAKMLKLKAEAKKANDESDKADNAYANAIRQNKKIA